MRHDRAHLIVRTAAFRDQHQRGLVRRCPNQAPAAVGEDEADAVHGDQIGDRPAGDHRRRLPIGPVQFAHPVDHVVLGVVGANGADRRGLPGLRQRVDTSRERRLGPGQHVQQMDRREQGVVVAPPIGRVEEPVAALLEAGDRVALPDLRLDVGMAGLADHHLGTGRRQLGVVVVEPGALDVDHHLAARVAGGDPAGDQQAELVGEDLPPLIVDHADPVAVAVDADADIGGRGQNRLADVVQEGDIFRVRVVPLEIPIRCAVELDHLAAEPAEQYRREPVAGAVAGGDHHLERPLQPDAADQVVEIEREQPVERLVVPGALDERAALDDPLEVADAVRAERRRQPVGELQPGPGVLVVARGHRGAALAAEMMLGEIDHRRDREADIDHPDPGR